MKSLIVDDSPGFRSLLQLILAPFSVCDLASDGEECVHLFERAHKNREPYNLICLDLTMPKLDGLETLKIIRNIERSWSIPEERQVAILIITSSSEKRHILEAHSRNSQGYILKPFKKNKIVETLAGLDLLSTEESSPPSLPPAEVKKTSHIPPTDSSLASAPPKLSLFVRPSSPDLGLAAPPPSGRRPHYSKLLSSFDSIKKGQPLAIPLLEPDERLAGEGVHYDPRKAVYRAAINGRAELGDDSTIAVKDFIIIHGDVDSKTGSIDFLGRIEVRGDVKNGFSVKARKGIQITGSAGASILESDGDITVDTIRSQERCLVKCGGTFRAKSISHATVECLGDVLVTTEILQSSVKTRGAISIPQGQIAGGTCIALMGVEAGKIGTDNHTLTKILAGADYRILDCVQLLKDRLVAIVQRLEEVTVTLTPFADALPPDADGFAKLPEKRRNQLLALLEERRKLEEQKPHLEKQFDSIQLEFGAEAVRKVNVLQTLMPGVVVELGATTKTYIENQPGPISIIESPDAKDLVTVPHSPLLPKQQGGA